MEFLSNSEKHYSSITLEGSDLKANGHVVFSEVPSNIIATNMKDGCFVGFNSKEPSHRHVVSLGKLKGIKFMSIFRFKLWWTTHWVGNKGSDVELETQMMLLDKSADSTGRPYVFLLPLIEGSFSTSLQGRADNNNNVDVCVESGCSKVTDSSFKSILYMHVGDDPCKLIKDAMKVVREHLGTFKLLEEKTLPGIVDKFGWCSWDAFYRGVHAQGVWEGVKSLVEGGCPPGFVLIDDGWQTICRDGSPVSDQYDILETFPGNLVPTLIDFQENHKFKRYNGKNNNNGISALVEDLKQSFKTIEYVYVWHAMCGHWGGIRPEVPGMPESRIVEAKLSPGLKMTMKDSAVDVVLEHGVGMVLPNKASQMYEGIHSHLDSVGIDGVKIDYIHVLETLCEEYGGRVELAKMYYQSLTASVIKYFKGNGVIASMQQCNDFMLLGTEAITLGRVGDDFWTAESQTDPSGVFWLQGCHMVYCAYNSLWMGNFFHPDWDMFQSTHPCAQFHAASRAISGGPIYVSDDVGKHDFKLLKSLALPDGSILRCESYALPTRDCLFEDPLHDGKTLLKIWNLNTYTGVIGAFNCQGGGWSRKDRQNKSFSEFAHIVTATVNPKDVEWENGKNPISIDEVDAFAVYAFQARKLVILDSSKDIEISLEPFTFELLTVSPVNMLWNKRIHFAALGLINMLNTGGAIQSLKFDDQENVIQILTKGTGEMRVFASERPKVCTVNGGEVSFMYADEMVAIHVPWKDSSKLSVVNYYF